jgi:hypothetical protein
MSLFLKNLFLFPKTKNPLLYGRIFGIFIYLELILVVAMFFYALGTTNKETGDTFPVYQQVKIEFNREMSLTNDKGIETPQKVAKTSSWLLVIEPGVMDYICFYGYWGFFLLLVFYQTYQTKMLAIDIAKNGMIHGRIVKRFALIESGFQAAIGFMVLWSFSEWISTEVAWRNEFVEMLEYRKIEVSVFLFSIFISYLIRMISTYIKNSLVGNK